MIKIGVKIQIKKSVLDSEGRSLLKILESKDSRFKNCCYGKYLELHIQETDEKKALSLAQKEVENWLHNPLIEDFLLEIIK